MANPLKGLLINFIHPKGWMIRIFLIVLIAGLWWAAGQGYLDEVRSVLDAPALKMDFEGFTLSPYTIGRSLFVVLLFFWGASFLTTTFGSYLSKFRSMPISTRALMLKIGQIVIYALLGMMALDVLGIDLTALTVFSGAIGIGLGFGFQKVASNFISGLILLFEKSVEVDDLIELDDGTAGFVRRTGGRYTLLETFDNREIMIPNEDFITSRVVNWTFTNKKSRIEIAIGVAYGTDYEKVHDLLLEIAHAHPDCSKDPEPICFLEGFADSSVNFTLYLWIDDVTIGRKKVKSEVLFALARKFDEHGIVIPFPQRDVHMIVPSAHVPMAPKTAEKGASS